ncbi:MAG: hypothetical protein WAV98_01610 [Minisyncoccia bacterium]
MNPDIFKEKRRVLIRDFKIAGALLILGQGLLVRGNWHNLQYVIQVLTFLGTGVMLVSLLNFAYFLVVSKKNTLPAVSPDSAQGNDIPGMRTPFKIAAWILFSLVILALFGMMGSLISSNF